MADTAAPRQRRSAGSSTTNRAETRLALDLHAAAMPPDVPRHQAEPGATRQRRHGNASEVRSCARTGARGRIAGHQDDARTRRNRRAGRRALHKAPVHVAAAHLITTS